MKFHGSYQQDDRERRTKGQGKFYQFMMRTRQPAGHVTNQLYKVMDDLADLVSDSPENIGQPAIASEMATAPAASLQQRCDAEKFDCSMRLLLVCVRSRLLERVRPDAAVWQWHTAAHDPASLPAARRAQGRPEVRIFHRHQKHGFDAGECTSLRKFSPISAVSSGSG